MACSFFFFQAEDGIRDLVRSRGLGDVYKRQAIAEQASSYPGFFAADKGAEYDRLIEINLSELELSLIHI